MCIVCTRPCGSNARTGSPVVDTLTDHKIRDAPTASLPVAGRPLSRPCNVEQGRR